MLRDMSGGIYSISGQPSGGIVSRHALIFQIIFPVPSLIKLCFNVFCVNLDHVLYTKLNYSKVGGKRGDVN